METEPAHTRKPQAATILMIDTETKQEASAKLHQVTRLMTNMAIEQELSKQTQAALHINTINTETEQGNIKPTPPAELLNTIDMEIGLGIINNFI